MRTITLTNDFHNTEVKLRVKDNELSPRQVKRAWRTLCGQSDCKCGNACGERGSVQTEQIDNDRVVVHQPGK